MRWPFIIRRNVCILLTGLLLSLARRLNEVSARDNTRLFGETGRSLPDMTPPPPADLKAPGPHDAA